MQECCTTAKTWSVCCENDRFHAHIYNYELDLPTKFMLVMLYLTRDPEVFHWTQV